MFGGYKALMIGVNLSGRHLLRGEGAEVRQLKAELQAANQKWTQACAALDAWENQLHLELLQCQVEKFITTSGKAFKVANSLWS